MVEGALGEPRFQTFQNAFAILQHGARRNPEGGDPSRGQPRGSTLITSKTIRVIMARAIDLHRQPAGVAVEVQNPGPDRMLTSEMHAQSATSDDSPDDDLRKRHPTTQFSCPRDSEVRRIHRSIVEPPELWWQAGST